MLKIMLPSVAKRLYWVAARSIDVRRRRSARLRSARRLQRGFSAERTFNVAVIGCGARGRELIQSLLLMPQVRVLAVADPSTQAHLWAKRHLPGVPCYPGIEEMVARVGELLDLATIATTSDAKVDVAWRLATAGIPRLLIEKPLATSVTKARQLSKYCTARGVRLSVCYNRRWSSDYAEIKAYVASGDLGKLQQIWVGLGGGTMVRTGSHFVDLIVDIADAPPQCVFGYLAPEVKAGASAQSFRDERRGFGLVVFQNGVTGFLDAYSNRGAKGARIHLQCERGVLAVDEATGRWVVTRLEGQRELSFTKPFRDVDLLYGCFLKAVIESLLDSPSSCTAEDALVSLEVIAGMLLSHHRKQQPFPLPLLEADAAVDFGFS